MTVFALAWLATVSVQTPGHQAPRQSLGSALDDAEAALDQFDRGTGRIDFNAWKAPEALVAAATNMLQRTRRQIVAGRRAAAILRKSERPSPIDLFLVLEALHAAAAAGNLGQEVGNRAQNAQLAGELMNAAESANNSGQEIKAIFSTLLLDRERELAECKGAAPPHP